MSRKSRKQQVELTRYWASWWSGNYANEGCTKPPFQFWNSGERERGEKGDTELSLCAVIDAPSEAELWDAVRKHFPDAEERFCHPHEADWMPGDRFPGFTGKTKIA